MKNPKKIDVKRLSEETRVRRAQELANAERAAIADGKEKFNLAHLEQLLGELPGTLSDRAESLKSKYYILHVDVRTLAEYTALIRELEPWEDSN